MLAIGPLTGARSTPPLVRPGDRERVVRGAGRVLARARLGGVAAAALRLLFLRAAERRLGALLPAAEGTGARATAERRLRQTSDPRRSEHGTNTRPRSARPRPVRVRREDARRRKGVLRAA
jgi:hypothetical protein